MYCSIPTGELFPTVNLISRVHLNLSSLGAEKKKKRHAHKRGGNKTREKWTILVCLSSLLQRVSILDWSFHHLRRTASLADRFFFPLEGNLSAGPSTEVADNWNQEQLVLRDGPSTCSEGIDKSYELAKSLDAVTKSNIALSIPPIPNKSWPTKFHPPAAPAIPSTFLGPVVLIFINAPHLQLEIYLLSLPLRPSSNCIERYPSSKTENDNAKIHTASIRGERNESIKGRPVHADDLFVKWVFRAYIQMRKIKSRREGGGGILVYHSWRAAAGF